MITRIPAAALLAFLLAGCGGGGSGQPAAKATTWEYRVVTPEALREVLRRADLIALGDTGELVSPTSIQPRATDADPSTTGDFDLGSGEGSEGRLSLQDYLNTLGADGWELVAVLQDPRPYPSSAHHEIYFRWPMPQLGSLLLKREG